MLDHLSPAGARETFTRFTTATADYLGKPGVFIVAVIAIVLWAASGPVLGFSDTWQLIINTGTTLVTFLMVFIIQNTQNRDSAAIHLKLDTLMREHGVQDPVLYDAENRGEDELEAMNEQITPPQDNSSQRRRGDTQAVDSGSERIYDTPTSMPGDSPTTGRRTSSGRQEK